MIGHGLVGTRRGHYDARCTLPRTDTPSGISKPGQGSCFENVYLHKSRQAPDFSQASLSFATRVGGVLTTTPLPVQTELHTVGLNELQVARPPHFHWASDGYAGVVIDQSALSLGLGWKKEQVYYPSPWIGGSALTSLVIPCITHRLFREPYYCRVCLQKSVKTLMP